MSECPRCHAPAAEGARYCGKCGAPIAGQDQSQAAPVPSAMPYMAFAPSPTAEPAQTSGLAIASFVGGLVSMFCLGLFTGIPSIIMGIVSLLRIKNSNGRLKGEVFAIFGICLGAASILTTGILLSIALPGFIRAREVARARSCQENLAMIKNAKEQYAIDKNASPNETPAWSDLVGQKGYLLRTPVCPGGGVYKINDLKHDPVCTYPTPPYLRLDSRFQHKVK